MNTIHYTNAKGDSKLVKCGQGNQTWLDAGKHKRKPTAAEADEMMRKEGFFRRRSRNKKAKAKA